MFRPPANALRANAVALEILHLNMGAEPPSRDRQAVRGQSSKAKRNMRAFAARHPALWLNPSLQLLTLTYGAIPPNPSRIREDVKRVVEWHVRRWPRRCGLWRMEFHARTRVHADGERRKAAHVHLVTAGTDGAPYAGEDIEALREWWIARTGLGGSTEYARRRRAVHVTAEGDVGAVDYIAKLGDEVTKAKQGAAMHRTGRVWGRVNGRVLEGFEEAMPEPVFRDALGEAVAVWHRLTGFPIPKTVLGQSKDQFLAVLSAVERGEFRGFALDEFGRVKTMGFNMQFMRILDEEPQTSALDGGQALFKHPARLVVDGFEAPEEMAAHHYSQKPLRPGLYGIVGLYTIDAGGLKRSSKASAYSLVPIDELAEGVRRAQAAETKRVKADGG